jgi:glutathione S-transferase
VRNPEKLTLVSHPLCPYVQRAVIALIEKDVPFARVDIDLANKPDWFKALSPLGKTPVLQVGSRAVFESAVILEYLEDTQPNPLHPSDPLRRAEHRALIEYGSTVLSDIGGFYTALDAVAFDAKTKLLASRFAWLEPQINGPWFDGDEFSLVDAVYGPIFRYFATFDQIGDFGILDGKSNVTAWRKRLGARPSVVSAVATDYAHVLSAFLRARRSHLSRLMADL